MEDEANNDTKVDETETKQVDKQVYRIFSEGDWTW